MNVRSYFARHAQTLIGSLGRLVKHPLASLLTMGVIAVALALPLFLNLFLLNARSAVGNWNDAFDLTVYIDKKAAAARTAALAQQLRRREDVRSVRVITAEQAMAEFREQSGFGKALDALEDNPLPDALVVTPTSARSTPQGMDALRAAIAALPDVQAVQLDMEWVRRLHAILEVLRRVVALTGGLLGAAVVLIVGNTVRLDILNRRAEIEVMKLVGASDGFARRPFLYSGVWYGLGGGLIALLLVAGAAALLAGPVAELASLYASQFHLEGLGIVISIEVLGFAVALSWLGSWFAATHHIRAIEPT